MKQLLIKSLCIIIFGMVLSFSTKDQQPKDLTATLSINEWNTVIMSISYPDDVTQNQKKEVIAKLTSQLQKQISDTTKKK